QRVGDDDSIQISVEIDRPEIVERPLRTILERKQVLRTTKCRREQHAERPKDKVGCRQRRRCDYDPAGDSNVAAPFGLCGVPDPGLEQSRRGCNVAHHRPRTLLAARVIGRAPGPKISYRTRHAASCSRGPRESSWPSRCGLRRPAWIS